MLAALFGPRARKRFTLAHFLCPLTLAHLLCPFTLPLSLQYPSGEGTVFPCVWSEPKEADFLHTTWE